MMTSKTGIINYGIGNVQSVNNAILKVGGFPVLTNKYEELLECDRLILPGVGAFHYGLDQLKKLNLDTLLMNFVSSKKPVFGICLGMQLLCESSTEFGFTQGLGFFEGRITKLITREENEAIRLPHVGWKSIMSNLFGDHWIFEGLKPYDKFYFLHSFAMQSNNDDVIASTEYSGINFASVIEHSNVIATQFHPEKSGKCGLRMLSNFVNR